MANSISLMNFPFMICLIGLIAIGMGISLSGYYTYLLSLSPEHTGLLSSIANVLGTLGCLMVPYFFVALNVVTVYQQPRSNF